MDKLEELLPDLEDYLRHVLAKEKLSNLAEKKRKYYVERLDIIKFNAPSLPPRPDGGLMKIPPETVINSSPLLSNKSQSNGHVTTGVKVKDIVGSKIKPEPEPELVEENIYADMEDGNGSPEPEPAQVGDPADDQDMLYLVPADNKTGSLTTDAQKSWSDSDSGTSYESYGEDDFEENTYDNVNLPEDVPLPRISKKKKKKAKNNEPEMWIKDLSNILFRGELYHKGSWQWNKRYCVISENRLLVYKTDKSARPFINFVLLGYNITYIEKEGRRSHVIQIAHQGCESHFFAADLKEISDLWLEYLRSAACTEIPSSGDSVNITGDSISGSSIAPDQHSMSTGSEGGSGDGVVSQNTQQPKVGDDKKLAADKDKKKKNIISDFLSGTFGKKKGQKQMKKKIELSDITVDPQARMAGVMDVCHETITKNSWCPRYCCVKDGRLECYYDNASDGIELALSLVGADIQNAAKETKKDLSIKLVWENGDSIMLDTNDTIEHGKWLHAFIMEREGIKDPPDGGATYENMEVMSQRMANDPEEEDSSIYDEVYDVQITTGKGDKIDAETAHALSQLKNLKLSSGYIGASPGVSRSPGVQRSLSIGSNPSPNVSRSDSSASDRAATVIHSANDRSDRVTIVRTTSSASDRSDGSTKTGGVRPPLPSSDPPKRPLLVKKRRSRIVEDGAEVHQDKVNMNLSEEMASAFTQIKSKMDDNSTWPSSQAAAALTTTSARKTEPADKSDDNGIIKGHSGPTIAEDKELLDSTQNSILSVLRQEKKKGLIDADSLGHQIDDIKRQLITLKKQKSELRSKILTSRGGREKLRLEAELHNMDQMVENAEQEITKLQLVAQEKSTTSLSRNSSFSSASSSRSNSLRCDADRPSNLKTSSPRDTKTTSPPGTKTTSTQGTKTTSTPGTKTASTPGTKTASTPGTKTTSTPGTKTASPRDNKNAVLTSREMKSSSHENNLSASKNTEKRTSPNSRAEARSIISKATSGAGMSKSWAKSTSSTSNTTRQAMVKFDKSGSNTATASSKKTPLTSTRLEPLKVGTTRVRTVHTTTSIQSGSSQGQRSTAGERSGSPPGFKAGSSNGQKQNSQSAAGGCPPSKPRKVVQERLKQWEAMSEDSAC